VERGREREREREAFFPDRMWPDVKIVATAQLPINMAIIKISAMDKATR